MYIGQGRLLTRTSTASWKCPPSCHPFQQRRSACGSRRARSFRPQESRRGSQSLNVESTGHGGNATWWRAGAGMYCSDISCSCGLFSDFRKRRRRLGQGTHSTMARSVHIHCKASRPFTSTPLLKNNWSSCRSRRIRLSYQTSGPTRSDYIVRSYPFP